MPPVYLFDTFTALRAASGIEWIEHRHFRGEARSVMVKGSEAGSVITECRTGSANPFNGDTP